MTTRRQYNQALARLEQTVGREFVAAVRARMQRAPMDELEAAVLAGDVDAISAAAGITPPVMSATTEAVRAVYVAGAALESPAARITFDIRNPRAEAWIRDNSSRLVTDIIDQQRDAIQIVLERGLSRGAHPRTTALDIAGRINRQTGRRTGGIVGLNSQQAQYVTNMRAQLASGDPSDMADYFSRVRRDRRFDGVVRRAIAEGRPVSDADINRIAARYSDRLLQLRAETIARTETINALNAARDEAWAQAIEAGDVQPQNVYKIWRASGSRNPRHDHQMMEGQTVRYVEPFTTPGGVQLMHPGDTSLGAGARDVANCGCFMEVSVDNFAELLG